VSSHQKWTVIVSDTLRHYHVYSINTMEMSLTFRRLNPN